ncbi:Mov34/MPN/PAD-1 family protein [Paraburkholderia tropica]|uniref:Mov34/MPN/PAD-1 family protein n=1 Tax=Paraburkholderia tropica TaxID=92647 RepID=UPI002ABD82A4|nr:Mov34/MPN/PAD-1 family protein [Paraburkholderia tropica]
MITISIPPDIERTLLKALKTAGSKECGGVLMGEHMGPGQFAVRHATVQGGGRFSSFVRDTQTALRSLRTFFRQTDHDYARFNYLGEWHSHPSFSVQPSTTDHQAMLDIVKDVRVGANFVVLLIVKLSNRDALEASAHTYLPDGSFALSTLIFQGTL